MKLRCSEAGGMSSGRWQCLVQSLEHLSHVAEYLEHESEHWLHAIDGNELVSSIPHLLKKLFKHRQAQKLPDLLINNAQLEHLQDVNDSNAFEVEHLLSKLIIADKAILGFREAFSNVEEHVVEMETLFEERNHQIAELKAEKESIIDGLVQTFQVNVSLRSSLDKAYRDMGDLAMSALLAHHADLETPLASHHAQCYPDTPELEALLESVSRPLESNLLFFHEILRARGVLKQLYPFNWHMICRPFPPSTTTDSPVPVHGHIAPPLSPALSSLSTNDSLPDLIPLSDSSSSSVSSKQSSEEMEKGMEEDWSIVDNKRPKFEHLL
ncbi:hypothetical protein BT96DRAFT_1005577 [Gymnopus androsaceus JB14]|uniref:Uncharacterized protein n=1 Tax=Gymnopus androsaceus JB14 TaxID=1447944 RepID=A0A6A4GP55_9AGAR|nr:hypothetical protein BT96DRAFT_1005577 [Gymnopus androsaceus JB14]